MRAYWKTFLIGTSLAANTLGGALVLAAVQKKGGVPWLQRKISELLSPEVHAGRPGGYSGGRISIFEELPIQSDDIVFLGDSIFDYGEWHEFMDDHRAKNRAIRGDDTSTVLSRLDQIVKGSPAHIVLLLGINNFQKRFGIERTTAEYSRLVERILSETEATQVWIVPAFPVNPGLYRSWILSEKPGVRMPPQKEVENLNRFKAELADSFSERVWFVPVPGVLDPSGHLGEDFTYDGLHLNGSGLKEVAVQVKRAIENDS